MSEHGGSGTPEWPAQPPAPGSPPMPPQPAAPPPGPAPSPYEPPPVSGGYGAPTPQPYPEAPPTPNYAPPPHTPVPPAGQAAPWGQPGTPPPPAAGSKTPWLKILGFAVVAGLLLIGGCTYFVIRAVSGPIDAANEFLADVAAQDFDAAVAHIDSSCFDPQPTADDLLQVFGPGVQSYNLNSSQNSNNLEGSSSGSITRDGFGEQPIEFRMSRPFEDWLVCGFRIGNGG